MLRAVADAQHRVDVVVADVGLLALAQGAVAAIVYVYVPAVCTEGSNIPPTRPPLHVPPASGVPFSAVKRFVGAPWSQSVMALFVPASGLPVSFTVTVALAFPQGAVPLTVYT